MSIFTPVFKRTLKNSEVIEITQDDGFPADYVLELLDSEGNQASVFLTSTDAKDLVKAIVDSL